MNPSEIIDLLSDDDTPTPGDADNPIVLSDDEAEPIPVSAQRDTAIPSSSNSSQSLSQRKNLRPVSPSSSNRSARCHDSQSRNSPSAVGDARDENVPTVRETTISEYGITEEPSSPMQFHATEPPSTPTTPPLPHSDLHSVKPVDESPAANIDTDQMPSPIQNGSEVLDNVPNTVLGPMCGGPFRVGSASSTPIRPKPRNMGISPRTAMVHNPSSPNRGHDLQTNSSADASPIRVRGTRFRAAGEQGSPSRPFRGIEDQGDARPKEGSNAPPTNSSRTVSSSTLVSLARNMSIRSSPIRSSLTARDFGMQETHSPSPKLKSDFGMRALLSPSPKLKSDFGMRALLSPSPVQKSHFGMRALLSPPPVQKSDFGMRVLLSPSPELRSDFGMRTTPSPEPQDDSPETPGDLAITAPRSVSPVTSGEFSKSITFRRHSASHRLVRLLK